MPKPSLYGEEPYCIKCGRPAEWHHVYPSSRRKASTEEGCVCPLCREHHQGRTGVHQDRGFDVWLKADCQRRWEAREGINIPGGTSDPEHNRFRAVFFANYLD